MTASASAAATSTIDTQARRWLRLEGLAVLVAGAVAFGQLGGEFLWFLPALLVPDLAIAGYLGGPRIGAFVYNLVHGAAFGLAVAGAGLVLSVPLLALAGAVLVAHSGMDRAAGYGLKLASGFQDTHLGRIGKSARGAVAAHGTDDTDRALATTTVAG
jgi:hypothetical protein